MSLWQVLFILLALITCTVSSRVQGLEGDDDTAPVQGLEGDDDTTPVQGLEGDDDTAPVQGLEGDDDTAPVQGLEGADDSTQEEESQAKWVSAKDNLCMIAGQPVPMDLCVARYGEEEVASWPRVRFHKYSSITGSNIG